MRVAQSYVRIVGGAITEAFKSQTRLGSVGFSPSECQCVTSAARAAAACLWLGFVTSILESRRVTRPEAEEVLSLSYSLTAVSHRTRLGLQLREHKQAQ